MSAMVDPYIGYLSFRNEVEQGNLLLRVCKIYPEMKVHFDNPEGATRFTYTVLKNNTPKGILQITPSGWDGDIFYFQLGFAVGEEFRNQGIGSELSQKGIEEFLKHIPLPPGKTLGIEAIISESNLASQKLAAKIFSNLPVKIIDKQSGESALRYEFIVSEKDK